MQTLTVAELAAEWRATWPGRLAASSQERADQILALYILPRLGGESAATLTHADVARFLGRLPSAMSPGTVRKVHTTLSAVFTEGIRAGHVRVNPCRHQRLPRAPKQERQIVTPEQAEAIAEAARGWGLAVRLAIYSGLRAGERWALRTSDLKDGRLTVARSLKLVGGRHQFGPTKTHRVRRVSLPSWLAEELANRATDGLLFRGANGAPIRHNLFVGRVFRPACERVGITGLRWHDLRHSHGSHLLARGVPIHVVKERLGHASIQTTVDVYGHLMPGADDEVARLLEAPTGTDEIRSAPNRQLNGGLRNPS